MNIFIFLAAIFIFTLFFGRLIEKIRVPWVFAALFLGLGLSIYNPFNGIIESESFVFLANLGMYFLLFMIGLEIDVKEIMSQSKFIGGLSLSLVFLEALIGAILIHYIFVLSRGLAILVASSFATVGEAILIPILDEFKITKTKFGQTILGVGTFDDIIEIIVIIIASFVLGSATSHAGVDIIKTILLLTGLSLLPVLIYFYKKKIKTLKFKRIPPLFLFGLILLFLFIGVGMYSESAALGAILAGISLKSLLEKQKIEQFESIVRTISYGFFTPIFFVYIGSEINAKYLLTAPLLILLFILVTKSTKIFTSWFFARKKFGVKKSVLLGIALSAKFSTSIVVITLLLQKNIISQELYSVLIGAMILSKFIIPVLFSTFLKRRNLKFIEVKNHIIEKE